MLNTKPRYNKLWFYDGNTNVFIVFNNVKIIYRANIIVADRCWD